jgi:hypothetical protein
MWQVESRYGPVMEVFEVEGTRERRLVIGYKMGGTSRFFRSVCQYIQQHNDLTYLQRALASVPFLPAILGPEVCRAILQWDHNYLSIPEPVA